MYVQGQCLINVGGDVVQTSPLGAITSAPPSLLGCAHSAPTTGLNTPSTTDVTAQASPDIAEAPPTCGTASVVGGANSICATPHANINATPNDID